MDHGRHADGVKVVEAIHRRYMRSGQPWNHVECGGHYSRAMSSWATLLAATGFKPDAPNETLSVLPTAPGDFRAPWVTADGFGTISRTGHALSVSCVYGSLRLRTLRLSGGIQAARLNARAIRSTATVSSGISTLTLHAPLVLSRNQTLTLE
jgi:hypothetical protein